MECIIKSTSIESAFEILKRDLEEENNKPKTTKFFINMDKLTDEIDEEFVESVAINGLIFGYTISKLGLNENKVQVSIKNYPTQGEKKWETVYLALYDNPNFDEVVPNSRTKIKKDCIDAARKASEEEGRNTFIIVGKSAANFNRLEAAVLYKTSSNQKLGEYKFIW